MNPSGRGSHPHPKILFAEFVFIYDRVISTFILPLSGCGPSEWAIHCDSQCMAFMQTRSRPLWMDKKFNRKKYTYIKETEIIMI